MSRALTSQSPPKALGGYYGYVMVALTFVIMALAQGLYMVFGIFLDPLLTEFGWTRAMISGAYSVSLILGGMMAIVMGGLSDKFGPRLVVTFSGLCLGLGYLLMSRVSTLWHFYLFYGVLVGIGMSGLWIPLLSSIARWFTGKRSLMTGIVLSGLTVGQMIAPLVVSRLIAGHGWRLSFLMVGAVVLLVLVLAAQFLRRNPDHLRPITDEGKGEKKRTKVAALIDFSFKEAVRTSQFWLIASIFYCSGFVGAAVLVHIVPHATMLGFPAVTTANILAINGGVGIIGNFVLGGIIGDRIGNRKAFSAGAALLVASLLWLVVARELWALYLFAMLSGIGLGAMGTSESPLIARFFGLRSHGLIYSVVGLGWVAGAATGPTVAGYMCDVLGDYQLAFVLCTVISVICLILMILLRPAKKRGFEV